MARTDALEHDTDQSPEQPPKKLLTRIVEALTKRDPAPHNSPFADARGNVFVGPEGPDDDDGREDKEPAGFDPVKSRYLEGLR